MDTSSEKGKVEERGSGKKVTIYDLARHTGFSPGTVSRVLNNKDRVKAKTREIILAAAKELDLKPQVSARSRQVAIITEPNFTDRIEGYAATLNAHLAFAFSKRNIGVSIPSDPVKQLPSMFLDGIVAVTYDEETRTYLQSLESKLPVVYMDLFEERKGVYRVCSDHYKSGVLAAKHFIEKGKKRLAFLGGEGHAFEERLKGYRDAIVEAGLEADENLFVQTSDVAHTSVVPRLVRQKADAVFVPGTSYQALQCLHLLTYIMNKDVPSDIAIIGGENDGVSELLYPPLTTVAEPLREMAESAVQMLDTLTSGKRVKAKSEVLPVSLIERNSVV
ncbi:LacI family DNA-binding transcriptional regulator [Pelagicoccus mobilis]|uniref:LacI family DNA-binding transcriptional regulator n=1 Tax=Pelagicoccus mobilis TaxID=415221 RepID=A0A934RXG8_9BACT|nr:LacI family DNA-binding transcriptional regulator [Pelagicoccus mobilis]MBK1878351.1 LacI family DNA-binding transcriptional regulator [Pelagicoccus mobilis]